MLMRSKANRLDSNAGAVSWEVLNAIRDRG